MIKTELFVDYQDLCKASKGEATLSLGKALDENLGVGYSITAMNGDLFGYVLKRGRYSYTKRAWTWIRGETEALGKWQFPETLQDLSTLLINKLNQTTSTK